jgi:hypothetical protein
MLLLRTVDKLYIWHAFKNMYHWNLSKRKNMYHWIGQRIFYAFHSIYHGQKKKNSVFSLVLEYHVQFFFPPVSIMINLN